ncbi:hypothetical protein DOY81_002184, partial [Sarcophaga bullata]
ERHHNGDMFERVNRKRLSNKNNNNLLTKIYTQEILIYLKKNKII